MVALAVVAGPWLVDAGGWKPAGVTQAAFVLALAAGLAANGVPIVARILEERGLMHSEAGAIVISSAAVVTGLALIASAVAIGGGDMAAGGRGGRADRRRPARARCSCWRWRARGASRCRPRSRWRRC